MLYNRIPRSSRSRIGQAAGSYDRVNGYTTVDIHGQRYLLHRIIYKWVTGLEPGECLDHVGQEGLKPKHNAFHALDSTSNRINLSRAHALRNASGYQTGVRRSGNKYTAGIGVGRHKIYLGVYATESDAALAYADAAACLAYNSHWRPDDAFFLAHKRLFGYSRYRGVSFHKASGKWRAQLLDQQTGKVKHLGLFSKEDEARLRVEQVASKDSLRQEHLSRPRV